MGILILWERGIMYLFLHGIDKNITRWDYFFPIESNKIICWLNVECFRVTNTKTKILYKKHFYKETLRHCFRAYKLFFFFSHQHVTLTVFPLENLSQTFNEGKDFSIFVPFTIKWIIFIFLVFFTLCMLAFPFIISHYQDVHFVFKGLSLPSECTTCTCIVPLFISHSKDIHIVFKVPLLALDCSLWV